MDGNTLVKFWPNDDYPRSPAVLKKKLTDTRAELKMALGVENCPKALPTNPEADGINLMNHCFLYDLVMLLFAYFSGTNAPY
jgi:hypothetical protein